MNILRWLARLLVITTMSWYNWGVAWIEWTPSKEIQTIAQGTCGKYVAASAITFV